MGAVSKEAMEWATKQIKQFGDDQIVAAKNADGSFKTLRQLLDEHKKIISAKQRS